MAIKVLENGTPVSGLVIVGMLETFKRQLIKKTLKGLAQ